MMRRTKKPAVKEELVLTTLRYVDLPTSVREFVEFSVEESRALAAVNEKVAAAQSLAEVMDFVFETTGGVCPCDRIGLAFLEEGGRLVSHWARAAYEPLLLGPGYAEDLHGSSLEGVIAGGQPRIISDLEAYLGEHPRSSSTALLVREGVRSSMTCPLSVDGRAVGVMFRSSRKANAYDEHQVRLHLAIAERLAQAVEKAWRIEQLAAANRAYNEVLAFVSHELKSPLASTVMDGQALIEGYLGTLEPRQADAVARMVRKSQHLLGLVRDYLDLARIESGELRVNVAAGVDLVAAVIEPAVELAGTQLAARGSRLTRDFPAEPLLLDCDPELLRIVLVNLLTNAAKYGSDYGEVRISARRDDGAVSVAVRNDGPGFPEGQRALLFRKFSRLQIPELLRERGSGVGLYTCWRIIQLHGGRIRAASDPGHWAEFAFTIPVTPQPIP